MSESAKGVRAKGTRPHLRVAAVALSGLVALGASAVPAGAAPGVASVSRGSATSAPAGPGRLLWAEHAASLSASRVRASLSANGFDAGHTVAGVDLWRLTYATVDPQGRSITASGLVVVPRVSARALRTVVVEHGTLAYRGDAPSAAANPFVTGAALQAASAGYVAVAPDYLGLGYGAGTHPYHDIPTEVSATIDLLSATRSFLPRTGHEATHDLLVSGFSQGASAALGVARAVQANPGGWWRVRAVSAISGAYDATGAEIPALVSGEVPGPVAAYYVSYVLVAYNKIHHLYQRPEEVFRSPYAARVSTLFGGNVQETAIFAALPQTLNDLLTARGMALLTDHEGPLKRALRDADRVCSWRAGVPVRLYYVPGDEQVVNANLTSCAEKFASVGVDATTAQLPTEPVHGSLHLGSAITGANRTFSWFLRALPPA
ncbi:MAG: hypothetical protein V9G19_16100 [Tetrasphaera sp.]